MDEGRRMGTAGEGGPAGEMVISSALPEDSAAVARLLRESWRDTYGTYLTEETLAEVAGSWHTPQRLLGEIGAAHILFLVARHPREGALALATALPIDERSVLLSRLYVRPDRQGQGIGRRLLYEVIAAFPTHRRLRLEVGEENVRGRAFYKREGFRQVATRRQTIGNETLRLIVMEKILGGPAPEEAS